jgi:adenylate cyclase
LKRIVGISSLTFILALVLYLSFPGRHVDMKTYDAYSCVRGPTSPPTDIVIVGIDPESFSMMKRPWPWPRSIHGKLIRALGKAGAKGIVMDIIFSNPSSPREDRALAEAIREVRNVVLAADIEIVRTERFSQSMLITPIEELVDAGARFGVSSIPLDSDNVVRRIFWGTPEGPSLEVSAVEMLGISAEKDVARMVHFAGSAQGFPYAPYYQALDPERHLPEGFFKDKVVLVGKHSQAKKESFSDVTGKYRLHLQPPSPVRGVDMFATPSYIMDNRLSPGIEIHASTLQSLIRDDQLRPLRTPGAVILLALLSIFLTLVNRNWSPLKSVGVNFVVGIGYLFVSYLLFSRQGLFLPFAAPLGAVLVNFISSGIMSYVGVERKRRYLKEAFSHYLSPQVAKKVLQDPERLRLGGQRVQATVLFSDLGGFTEMSERLEPEEVVSIMTRYMTEMTRVIFKYNGTLDKFIGDAIMAVWGAPAEDEDQALHACMAALEMQRRTKTLSDEIMTQGYRLSMRIGINTGIVMAGNMGSEERFDFTVIGDNVNIASRLEGMNKVYGTRIMISDATRARLDGRASSRELGSVRVKGKKQAIRVYELVDGERSPWVDVFEEGLRFYREGRFDSARERFSRVLEIEPDDKPGRLYLEQCDTFVQTPPPKDWDGVMEF